MTTYEHKFDPMIQELLKQKQQFEALVTENQELHRQLADLRGGRGLFVEIDGERFGLGEELVGNAQRGFTSRPPAAPTSKHQTGPVTEERAALRQELVGSFLLE